MQLCGDLIFFVVTKLASSPLVFGCVQEVVYFFVMYFNQLFFLTTLEQEDVIVHVEKSHGSHE